MNEGGEEVGLSERERKQDNAKAESIGGEEKRVWDRVRPPDYLVLLREVNKLPKSKASWSSIFPKWEVGELEWGEEEGGAGAEWDRGE